MDIREILSYVYMALGTIALIAGIVARFTKSKKVKAAAEYVREQVVDVAALMTLIAEADAHKDYGPENKRDYVISRYLEEHTIKVAELDDIITNLVAFTKVVNADTVKPDSTINSEVKDNDARGAKAVCRIAR